MAPMTFPCWAWPPESSRPPAQRVCPRSAPLLSVWSAREQVHRAAAYWKALGCGPCECCDGPRDCSHQEAWASVCGHFSTSRCLPPGLGAPVFPHLTSMAGSAARTSMDRSALCAWNGPFPDAVHGGVQEARVVIACSDPRQTHASPAQIPGCRGTSVARNSHVQSGPVTMAGALSTPNGQGEAPKRGQGGSGEGLLMGTGFLLGDGNILEPDGNTSCTVW